MTMSDLSADTGPVKSSLIYQLMPAVMKLIGAIGKGRKNQQQGYSFRGIDDVYNEIHDALAECQVFPVPRVLEQKREQRETKNGGVMFHVILLVETRFYAPDGSSVAAVTVGEAMDTSDKASNKAMSVAMKYALLETFCIPTEESKDPEDDHLEARSYRPTAPSRESGSNPAPLGASSAGVRSSQPRHGAQGDPATPPAKPGLETAGPSTSPPPSGLPTAPAQDSPGEPSAGRAGPTVEGGVSEELLDSIALDKATSLDEVKQIGIVFTEKWGREHPLTVKARVRYQKMRGAA